MSEKNDLLVQHYSGTITKESRNRLHSILAEERGCGSSIQEYCCKSCGRPLVFTWAWGFCCPWSSGGCGAQV